MLTKYRVSSWRDQITEEQFTRETDSTLFHIERGRERKKLKHTTYEDYFDSWQDAYKYLLVRAECKVEKAEADLRRATEQLERVKSIAQPNAAPGDEQ